MEYKLKKLKNGLRVLVVPMENTETITVTTFVATATDHETRKDNGISHYLEHMFFKGTKKYPSAEKMSKRLDSIGAIHNAFTGREETAYYVKTHKKHFALALDFFADALQNALIPEREVERERKVILEEIKMYEDSPQRKVWVTIEELIYGDQAAGWDIGGTPEILETIKQKDILIYKNRQYVASNTVLVIAGNISTDDALRQAEDAFAGYKKGKARGKSKFVPAEPGPRIKVVKKDVQQVNMILGVSTFPTEHKDSAVVDVLAKILGGSMTSRLFLKIRERRGLAYVVSAEQETYLNRGHLAIYAGIPLSSAYKVPELIVEEFNKIIKNGVTAVELKNAKENTRGKMSIRLENTDAVALFVGEQELLEGKVRTPDQRMAEIDAVTQADIQRVAKQIFKTKNYYIAAVGNGVDEDKLLDVIKKS